MIESAELAARAHLDLVRAAVSAQGAGSIAERVADAVQCWVVLLDDGGALRAAVPDSARAHARRIRLELPRLTGVGRVASLSIVRPGESVAIRRIGVAGRTRAFMAIGRSTPLDPLERSLADTAAALIAADLQRRDELLDTARNGRLAVFDLLLNGHVDVAAATSALLKVPFPHGLLRVALLEVPRALGRDLLEAAEDDLALRRLATVTALLRPGRVGVILPAAEGDVRTLQAILRQVPHGRGAVSDPVEATELPDAWQRVRSVFRVAPDQPGKLHVARDVVEVGLLTLLSGTDSKGWAEVTLAPLVSLERGSKIDYIQTLRTFLANNGRADASAKALAIHRHTLRYRMSQIADALGRDLDDPTVRSELWFALQIEAV